MQLGNWKKKYLLLLFGIRILAISDNLRHPTDSVITFTDKLIFGLIYSSTNVLQRFAQGANLRTTYLHL